MELLQKTGRNIKLQNKYGCLTKRTIKNDTRFIINI